MEKKECIAMILAGGQGTRLGTLTKVIAKPAMPFGGKHRLIDFTLSNCFNSGVDTVGVLMPPRTFDLHNSMEWAGNLARGGNTAVYTLPPRAAENSCQPYKGTANAVYENISFIEQFNPELVLVLSGDHIYKMDYNSLLAYHREKEAAATIAVIGVPWAEASRFGIMAVRPDGGIAEFTEKPQQPKSNLASMGVYVFTWEKLKNYLLQDEADLNTNHDFGKNIIPTMLAHGEGMYAYSFKGYWKDVGTVESLYEAHMDLLGDSPAFSICDERWPVFSTLPGEVGQVGLVKDTEKRSLFHSNCSVQGRIEGTILFSDVQICNDATVKNSVVMPGAVIGEGAYIERAIIGHGAIIGDGYTLRGGIEGAPRIAVISENAIISAVPNLYATSLC